jgi:hypothetical protein
MDYLCNFFKKVLFVSYHETNLEYVGNYHFHPHSNLPHVRHIIAHQQTLHHAFERFLYPDEIDKIENKLRRSEMTEQAILDDFFANDVEKHEVPMDTHFEYGLSAMLDAFRPPQKCLPAHIFDVQHHYPYKWQVNAEVPFSTDSYFLKSLPTFGQIFKRLHDVYSHISIDWHRRYGSRITTLMNEKIPAKFGPLKETVFSWTHRWHHVIKSNFLDLAGLEKDYYFDSRYIFPMLLHTKTAIVKKDDPNKMRTIWGCSKPWVIGDTQFYWEYTAWIKLNPGHTPMLWGYETITGGWLRLNAALFSRFAVHSFLTLDWKRFDKRAYFSVIKRIMLGVRQYLDFSNGYLPTKDYPDTDKTWNHEKAIRLERLWLWTLENLFNAPIVLPDGSMYVRHFAGIPSGLFITQLLDSWYNYTMLATILSVLGFDPRACIIKVQGDDSIVRLNVLIPPEDHDSFLLKMQELADYYFKAVISIEKSEVRNALNGCEVLSYRHKNGLPYRDEIAMLAQFYHTKARNPNPSITMAQAVGFAYASCGNNERVLLVLQDVYEYYAAQGYEPNRAGVSLVFGNSPDLEIPYLDLSHFPDKSEIKRFLLSGVYHNEETRKKTWPLGHFLFPPCERPV